MGVCTNPCGLVHSAHAAHAGIAGGHWGLRFFDVAEDALGGQQHAGDAGSILEGHTGNLGGVDNVKKVRWTFDSEAENKGLMPIKILLQSFGGPSMMSR